MAENKKSFVAYNDWESQLDLLSDEEAGKLFRHLLAYVNDRNPEFSKDERILKMAFEPIRLQLKRDLDKYEEVKKKRSEAGRSGGLKSAISRSKTEQNETNEANASNGKANESFTSFAQKKEANEPVIDNDSVNVNDTDILLEKESKGNILFPEAEIQEEKIEIPKNPKSSKEKSSAKKESPEPEKAKAKIFFFKQAMIDYGFNPGLIDHFILVRKKKRLVNTEVAFNIFTREIEKTGKDKNEVFEIIVKKQWGGFEASWYKKLEDEQSSNKTNNGTFNGGKQNDKVNGRSNQFTINDFIEPSNDS